MVVGGRPARSDRLALAFWELLNREEAAGWVVGYRGTAAPVLLLARGTVFRVVT